MSEITTEAEIARLRALNAELVEAARKYVAAAEYVGGCGDGNCVVLRPTGMHTNGGCRCTYNMDRARERGVRGLLMIAQSFARAAIAKAEKEGA